MRVLKRRSGKTYKVLHGLVTRLVDTLHVLKDVMSVRVNHGYSDVIVVRVLGVVSSTNVGENGRDERRTEYEFSPRAEEPVARIFGE